MVTEIIIYQLINGMDKLYWKIFIGECIWNLPRGGANYSMRWSQIKRLTTQACPQYHLPKDKLSASRIKRNEKGIWQRRFYEHKIRNEQDLITHMDYLHYNPVKHGLRGYFLLV